MDLRVVDALATCSTFAVVQCIGLVGERAAGAGGRTTTSSSKFFGPSRRTMKLAWATLNWILGKSRCFVTGPHLETIERILVMTSLEALPQWLTSVDEMHHCLINDTNAATLVIPN